MGVGKKGSDESRPKTTVEEEEIPSYLISQSHTGVLLE